MKPFDVTITFSKNLGRRGGPPKWEQRQRVERVFASDSTEAARIVQGRSGARVVTCVCLWGN